MGSSRYAEIPSAVDLPRPHQVFKAIHIDPLAAELNSLKLQAFSLLMRASASELDLTTRAEHAVPWQLIDGIDSQQASHGAMISGIACSRRNSPVGAYLAGRYGENHAADREIPLLVLPQSITSQPPFALLDRKLVCRKSLG